MESLLGLASGSCFGRRNSSGNVTRPTPLLCPPQYAKISYRPLHGGPRLCSARCGAPPGRDLGRGPADPGNAVLSDSAAVGDVLYFPDSDPAHGTEVWRSDGTHPSLRQPAIDRSPRALPSLRLLRYR